jgi:hypothetical protein
MVSDLLPIDNVINASKNLIKIKESMGLMTSLMSMQKNTTKLFTTQIQVKLLRVKGRDLFQ